MTDNTFNCKDMFRMNDTAEYIEKMSVDQQDELLLLGHAREQRLRRDAYAEVELWEQQATENVETHRIRMEKQRKAAEELMVWLDTFAKRRKTRPVDITPAMLNTELNDELLYHRHRGFGARVPEHPDAIKYAPTHFKRKDDKIDALKRALLLWERPKARPAFRQKTCFDARATHRATMHRPHMLQLRHFGQGVLPHAHAGPSCRQARCDAVYIYIIYSLRLI
ncbi:hypothetical protein AURDEDRAFT_176759 [Auricularia subglabra TFB-10046 SS5]|uniref:Uncharacterized protein n=1 Tax=Auricularia subglabra (strain TFB-10046 / SS5) TaxID=717982 RepID=J0CUY9_AURST|nr:hypothetical protein AURDEDRAFT_176759 [Auricularia subglabra TFB-10046 SS5]